MLVPALAAVAAALLVWSLPAQDPDGTVELGIPDLTITAEDPLILLPPLGPAADPPPVPLPAAARERAVPPEVPVLTPARGAPAPAPLRALATASAPDAVERTTDLLLNAALADGAVHATAQLEVRGPVHQTTLGLRGVVPVPAALPAVGAVHGRWGAPWGEVGLGLTLAAAAGAGEAGFQARLSGVLLAAQLGIGPLPSALEVSLGGALALQVAPRQVVPYPFARLTIALSEAKPELRVEAAVRPYIGYPHWLADETDRPLDRLPQERAWLGWLGFGAAAAQLRIGVTQGLLYRFPAVPASPSDTKLVQLELEVDTALHHGRAGDLEVRARVGAGWAWSDGKVATPRARLLVAAAWPVAPSLAVLLQAGWAAAPVYSVDGWPAGTPLQPLGWSAAAGMRWAAAHGHQLQLRGGVSQRFEDERLFPFVGIEYSRRVIRLVAPPAAEAP